MMRRANNYDIENYSPGYAWHGFVLGLYIVTFCGFLLSENRTDTNMCFAKCVLAVAVGAQVINCFVYYIPKQTKWYEVTKEAIKVLEENEGEIYGDVVSVIEDIGESYFYIDESIKRYKPVAIGPRKIKKIDMDNTYFVSTNFVFLEPLEAKNIKDWDLLKKNQNYTSDNGLYQYIIWIVPDCFKTIGDVADLRAYDGYDLKKLFIEKNILFI